MGVLTTLLKLLKPGENDYYNQQTEQADNWDKVDNYAVLTNTDKNGIWGGEYGGKIQDPIPKELNKRYIDNINGKAFICIKAGDSSVTSNTIEYFMPCNVVDNLGKLQNLQNYTFNTWFCAFNGGIDHKTLLPGAIIIPENHNTLVIFSSEDPSAPLTSKWVTSTKQSVAIVEATLQYTGSSEGFSFYNIVNTSGLAIDNPLIIFSR